jgi:hypothetical protein
MRQTDAPAAESGFVRRNRELIAALLSVLLLTAAYLLAARSLPMRASSPLNHGIGILGFLLMIATETLYSWRKTRRGARWGRAQNWLTAHIYTGIVGPYMVLLHTGYRFAGLAGVTFWMTVVVVCSGFVGRYLYTAIPRTPTGDELDRDQLQAAIRETERQLRAWLSAHPAQLRALSEAVEVIPVAGGTGLGGLLSGRGAERRYRQRWQQAVARLDAPLREQARELRALLDRRRALQRQAIAVAPARRLLAIWHTAHVPLAIAMFAAALLHVVAALYFS